MRLLSAILAFALAASSGASAAGREYLVQIDLARKNRDLSLVWTELQSTAVRVNVRDNGDDASLSGWDGYLAVGDADKGLVVEGELTAPNEWLFRVDASAIPTNGRYSVAVTAQKGYHTEEWARGVLRVNTYPGVEWMPTCWMGWQKVAKLAALYVSTNDLAAAFAAYEEDVAYDFDAYVRTNDCLVVQKTTVDALPNGARFYKASSSGATSAFSNVAYPDVRIIYGGSLAETTVELLSSGTVYSATNAMGSVSFRSETADGFFTLAEVLATNGEVAEGLGKGKDGE